MKTGEVRFLESLWVTRRHAAEAANRAQEHFFANISHELSGPLTAILTWGRLLQNEMPDEATTAPGLETIGRNVQAEVQPGGREIQRVPAGW